MTNALARLILVDDHPIVLEGIKISLMGCEDIEIAGEASNADELFALLEKTSPDIILLDISLPGMNGIEITRVISGKYSHIRVIVLSADIDEKTISAAISAGARGYLSKSLKREELLTAIRQVLHGEMFFSEQISRQIIKSYLGAVKAGSDNDSGAVKELSERETEIVRLIAAGLTYKEIGDRLFISTRTVETHRNNILAKLGLSTNADLIRYAIRHRIAEL